MAAVGLGHQMSPGETSPTAAQDCPTNTRPLCTGRLPGTFGPFYAPFWDGLPTKAGTREDCSDLINTLTHLTLYLFGTDLGVYSGIGLQQLKVQGMLVLAQVNISLAYMNC